MPWSSINSGIPRSSWERHLWIPGKLGWIMKTGPVWKRGIKEMLSKVHGDIYIYRYYIGMYLVHFESFPQNLRFCKIFCFVQRTNKLKCFFTDFLGGPNGNRDCWTSRYQSDDVTLLSNAISSLAYLVLIYWILIEQHHDKCWLDKVGYVVGYWESPFSMGFVHGNPKLENYQSCCWICVEYGCFFLFRVSNLVIHFR